MTTEASTRVQTCTGHAWQESELEAGQSVPHEPDDNPKQERAEALCREMVELTAHIGAAEAHFLELLAEFDREELWLYRYVHYRHEEDGMLVISSTASTSTRGRPQCRWLGERMDYHMAVGGLDLVAGSRWAAGVR